MTVHLSSQQTSWNLINASLKVMNLKVIELKEESNYLIFQMCVSPGALNANIATKH